MNASKLRLYHRLQVAAHAVQKAADRVIADAVELTTAQAAVLTVVAAADHVTQRDVAVALHLNESAVTAMAARLLRLGLLERVRSDVDPRAWRLRVSKAGRATMAASRAAFASINGRIENEFSQQEIKRLAEFLDRLTAAFEAGA
jgi:DNA-binding MarR family transcriptional regulator